MKLFILTALTIVAISCNDEKNILANACTPNVSIDNIPWIVSLKETITNCNCEVSIIKGTYENETVIFIALTDPLCDGIDTPTLYNCTGSVIRTFTDSQSDQKDLRDKVTRDSILYTCSE